jgi:3-dehydroquinate synthase
MVKLTVNLLNRSYPIYITTNYEALNKCFAGSGIEGKVVVITDSNVDKFQAKEAIGILESGGFELYKYVIPAGEKNKNLDTVKNIYKFLMDLRLDRSSTLVALGGGVVGDVTGFAAATFLRGINFVQVPTTLLAQADSSVGGKVGVDFEGSKNIVGSFYQPKFVYINVNTLRTLPKRELKSGLAEVIKHGIISDEDFYDYIVYNIDKIFNFDEDVLQYIIKVNCSIKGKVVEQDEKEEALRAILNFGHTIGHAIESVYQFKLLHGECISLGMVGAFQMAVHLEMVDRKTAEEVENTLNEVGLPVRLNGMDVEKVYNQLFFDKKIKKSRLKFILPKKIGQVLQLMIDDEALIKNVLDSIAR